MPFSSPVHSNEVKGIVCFIFEESVEAPSYTLYIYKHPPRAALPSPPPQTRHSRPTPPPSLQTYRLVAQ